MTYTPPSFPGHVWDGDTPSPWRHGIQDFRQPDPYDWDKITSEMIATQTEVKRILDEGTVNVRVGFFICPSLVGDYSVTGLGFKPKCVEFFVSKSPGGQTHFCCSTGMADEFGNQNSMTWAGIAVNCYRGDSSVDKAIHTTNVNAIAVEAGLVSMDSDGFTVNFTVANPVFIIRWKAIG